MSASTQAAPAPAPPQAPEKTSWIDSIVRAREVSLIGVLAILVIAVSIAEPRFLNAQNLRDILLNVTIVALLAVGQTIVVITRNIDLSVGSILGITAFATGVMFADHNVPIPLVFVGGMLFGAFFGLMNGVMVAWARVPEPRDHARHAVRDPRHRLLVGQRPADQRRRHARQLPGAGDAQRSPASRSCRCSRSSR